MPSDQPPIGSWYESFPPARDDAIIRAAGFRIFSRPTRGPVLWIRNGDTKPTTHAEALRQANLQNLD